MRKLIVFLIIITVSSWSQSFTVCADIYTWTDENGVKHYSNEPPPDNNDVEQRAEQKMDPGLRDTLDKQRSRKQLEMTGKVPVGSDERVTRNPGKVMIFTKSKCGDCSKIKDFFKEYGLTYTEYVIDKDEKAKQQFEAFRGRTVPLTFVGTRKFYGYNTHLLSRLYGLKGAPSGSKIKYAPK